MIDSISAKRLLAGIGASGVVVALAVGSSAGAAGVRTVQVKDQCDPATFNAAIGHGTCTGHNGGVPFDTFIAELQHTQQAGAWHFAPDPVRLQPGDAFDARNVGGETHTFTEVDEFGGGFVDFLNDLSGNPSPAPECLNLAPSDFIAPGGTTSPDIETPGVHHYQCCIHPWMRTDVIVK